MFRVRVREDFDRGTLTRGILTRGILIDHILFLHQIFKYLDTVIAAEH